MPEPERAPYKRVHVSRETKLHRAARPLRPRKAPFYVDHGTTALHPDKYPLIGWYWQPAGAAGAVALGSTYENAMVAIALKIAEAKAAATAAAAAEELADLEAAA